MVYCVSSSVPHVVFRSLICLLPRPRVLTAIVTLTDADEIDDHLAFLTSLQMFLTLLAGLLIKTDNPSNPTYDRAFLAAALVGINCLGFVALAVSLVLLHPKCRTRGSTGSKCSSSAPANSATKVVPSDGDDGRDDGGAVALRSWSAGGEEKTNNIKM